MKLSPHAIDKFYAFTGNYSFEGRLGQHTSFAMLKPLKRLPRPLIKTMTYSLMHLTVAVSVAYALTGNLAVALGIGLIEPFVQTFAYSLHERAWAKAGKTRPANGPQSQPVW